MALEQVLLENLQDQTEFNRLDLVRVGNCPFSSDGGWVALASDGGRFVTSDEMAGVAAIAWGKPDLAIALRHGCFAAVGPTPNAALSHLHQFLAHRRPADGVQENPA